MWLVNLFCFIFRIFLRLGFWIKFAVISEKNLNEFCEVLVINSVDGADQVYLLEPISVFLGGRDVLMIVALVFSSRIAS